MLSRGYIHRDLRPENILIEQDKVKICDFGKCVNTEKRVGKDGLAIVEEKDESEEDLNKSSENQIIENEQRLEDNEENDK